MNSRDLDSKSRVTQLYNRVAQSYGQIGPGMLDVSGKRLVALAPVFSGAKVLDIACGRGASLFPASEAVAGNGFVVGTDIAFQMVRETWKACQEKGFKNVRMMQMDGDHLSFPANSFDFILCGFAIFFFPRPKHALREWLRVLKPSGKLGICVASRGDKRWEWYEDLLFQYHKQYQFPLSANVPGLKRPDEIKDHLEEIGFKETEIVYEEYAFKYLDENQWWQFKWTHGARYPLEHMRRDVLEIFKTDVFKQLDRTKEETGLKERMQLAYIIGRKEA